MTTMASVSVLRAFLLLATLCGASSSMNSRVSIHIPMSLHHKEGEDHVKAEFGFKSRSGSIYAYVYYLEAGHNLCNSIDWNSNGTEGFPRHSGGMKHPYILMTRSNGDCSAVTKVRHAQQDGASALIIMNDDCVCGDDACTNRFNKNCKQENDMYKMLNDGSGSDVSIPSFLLNRVVATNISTLLKDNQPVLLELNWGMKGNTIDQEPPLEYNLWTTAHDPLLDIEAYKDFQTISKSLADHAIFKPRFSLIDGARFNCTKQAENGPCAQLCTNHGRYCAAHAWELSGKAIVKETLRRLCVYNHYDATTYLNYVLYHIEHCGHSDKYADEECIKASMDAAEVHPDVVETCFKDSNGLEDDKDNTFLQEQLVLLKNSSVVTLPSVTIGQRILEDSSSWSVFQGICHHFYTRNLTTTPDVCFTCAACPNTLGCLENGHCVDFQKPDPSKGSDEHNHRKKHHGWTVFWLLTLSLCVGGGYYYYKKMQDNEGFRRPGGTLNSYFQLSGEEN